MLNLCTGWIKFSENCIELVFPLQWLKNPTAAARAAVELRVQWVKDVVLPQLWQRLQS